MRLWHQKIGVRIRPIASWHQNTANMGLSRQAVYLLILSCKLTKLTKMQRVTISDIIPDTAAHEISPVSLLVVQSDTSSAAVTLGLGAVVVVLVLLVTGARDVDDPLVLGAMVVVSLVVVHEVVLLVVMVPESHVTQG